MPTGLLGAVVLASMNGATPLPARGFWFCGDDFFMLELYSSTLSARLPGILPPTVD